MEWLNTRTIYRHSSINRLAAILTHFLNTGKYAEKPLVQTPTGDIEDLTQKYAHGLAPSAVAIKQAADSSTVALVGSTGYLGPRILVSLLADPHVKSVFCLNRAVDAEEKMEVQLKAFGSDIHSLLSRVNFLVVDIGAPQLGLSKAIS
jgi:hypothetical protein